MSFEQVVAGRRVLRLLATGDRSQVWLVAGDRVLKSLTHPIGDDQPLREIEALHRARGDHVVELLDLSSDENETVLEFPRLPRGSLADLLAGRPALDAGEAVTILAPLASCLAAMHERGVAHGAVSPSNVLFRADGAPMLVGFGGALLFDGGLPEVERERIDGVVADRAGLAAMTDAVLARVAGPRASAAAALSASLRAADHRDLETRLTRELFDLAAARPVTFEVEAHDDRPVERVVPVTAPGRLSTEPSSDRAIPAWIEAVLESGPVTLVRRRALGVWSGWSSVRRRAVLGGAAGALVLVIAMTAVPSEHAAHEQPAVVVTEPAQPPPAGESAPDEDPLIAVGQLLARRTECFRDLSVLCLDDVDQQGSSALADDRATLDAIEADGTQPVLLEAGAAEIVERLGDTVLISLGTDSEPASVLLLKGEAGWRIRDYLP